MNRLVEYALALPNEAVPSLAIQDAALCDLWFAERSDGQASVDGAERIPTLVDCWLSSASQRLLESEGRRHQTLLRDLIDVLVEGDGRSLGRDELAFLLKVHEFTHRAKDPEAFARVRDLLNQRLPEIQRLLAACPPSKGLSRIQRKLRVVNTQDIQRSKSMEVQVIAGVELPARGPVLTQKGHLRVLGDVPEGATLVVEGGDCVVDGFVLGRVAVSGSCEVLENLSGVVISKNGDIRVRKIVSGAFVVSKRGWIHCRSVQSAELVFAGECINVRGEAIQCHLLAKKIQVEADVEGGEIHIGSALSAKTLKHSTSRPLDIVFRRRLSCKDYGEDPGREMSLEVSHASRLRAQLNYLDDKKRYTMNEAEQLSANTIAYLIMGNEIKSILDGIGSAQRRQNVVHRIILSLRALYTTAVSNLEALQQSESPDPEAELEDGRTDQVLDDLDSEIAQLDEDESANASIAQERQEMERVRAELGKEGRERLTLMNAQAELGAKLKTWLEEAQQLRQQIAGLESKLRAGLKGNADILSESKDKTKLQMLRHMIAKIQKSSSDSVLSKRVSESYTTLMLRSINARVESSKKCHVETKALREEFNTARIKIWDAYQLDMRDTDESEKRMEATGRFDVGARLHADPIFLSEKSPPGSDSSIVSTVSGAKADTYVCRAGKIEIRQNEEDSVLAT